MTQQHIDTVDRYAVSEQHRAPLRPPFNQPAFDPRVRVTLYRDGTVEKIIEGDIERVRRELAQRHKRDRTAEHHARSQRAAAASVRSKRVARSVKP